MDTNYSLKNPSTFNPGVIKTVAATSTELAAADPQRIFFSGTNTSNYEERSFNMDEKLRVTEWLGDTKWLEGQKKRMDTSAGKPICEILEKEGKFAIFRIK